MPLISHEGVDYGSFTYQVQDSATASDLGDMNVPTGRTIKSYLNGNLRNNELGSWVNIAGYTSTMYTCPSDGYVTFYGSNALIEFHSATNDNYFYAQSTSTSVQSAMYVRKGMRIKVVGTVSVCRFTPLT